MPFLAWIRSTRSREQGNDSYPISSHVLCVILVLGMSAMGLHAADSNGQSDLMSPEDFIIAIPSCVAYLPLVHATRPFRQGARAFIVLDSETAAVEQNAAAASAGLKELYAYHPDNPPRKHKKTSRLHEGRWLMTPLMAHNHYRGQYKWLLMGDDDTLWLLAGVYRLLLGYNPGMPYWISDSVVDLQAVVGDPLPRIAAGRETGTYCLPCHTPATVIDALRNSFPEQSDMRALEWAGCPCTALQGCKHRYARCQLEEHKGRFQAAFVGNKSSCSPGSSAYGGAGMVLSRAMMERLNAEQMRAAAPTLYQWADFTLAQHIHSQGYALTFPYEEVELTGTLDHHVKYHLFGHDIKHEVFQDPSRYMFDGKVCGGRHNCNWTLAHAVSCHLRHKTDPSYLATQLQAMAKSMWRAMGTLGLPREHLQA